LLFKKIFIGLNHKTSNLNSFFRMEEYLTLDTKIISDKAVSTIMPAQTDIQ